MAAGSNTKVNVGIRRMVYSTTPPGLRNFEPNGTTTYVVVGSKSVTHAGNAYAKGQTIAFDAAGGTKYSTTAQLERSFNNRQIDPSS
jgi:hypothetical protein